MLVFLIYIGVICYQQWNNQADGEQTLDKEQGDNDGEIKRE